MNDMLLRFVQDLLNNLHIPMRILTEPFPVETFPDHGLRLLLNPSNSDKSTKTYFFKKCKDRTIYRIRDNFMCHYLIFRMPDTKTPTLVCIGPYLCSTVSAAKISDMANHYHLTPDACDQLKKYYSGLPFLPDERSLLIILYTFGAHIWGNMNHFTVEETTDGFEILPEPLAQTPDTKEMMEPFLSMKALEQRYDSEKKLLAAVSSGQIHKAEIAFSVITAESFERRNTNLLKDLKNYSIILNTLLRKAAENGAVHPLHIDSLSTRYAKKIEALSNQASAMSLMQEMVRKYCLLVKNHSMKGYSLLIRKVLTQIDADLTVDLSLRTQARMLNVNPSYLSSLFKKEAGMPLTEYVNKKRMEHAIFLLNSTDMQIQQIAQHCGIPDVNYFTKTFKKIVGQTPKEYRDSIRRYGN